MNLTRLLNEFFIFEIANNHNGDMGHAMQIIESIARISRKYKLNAAVKFQFRNLDTFIHPTALKSSSNKHVKRFNDTALSVSKFKQLIDIAHDSGLYTAVTVFDEESIPAFLKCNPNILKIASCSATDYPLLNKLKTLNVPTIVSTGSLQLEDIQHCVSLLKKDQSRLAIMHCVAIYPTLDHQHSLYRIGRLRSLFPEYKIGFSSHEQPDKTLPVQLAAALGATFFEKHVDVPSEHYQINKYSATPDQIEDWLNAYFCAKNMCSIEELSKVREEELDNLNLLKRGAFAKLPFNADASISYRSVYWAFPTVKNQILADSFDQRGVQANKRIELDKPIVLDDVTSPKSKEHMIRDIMDKTFIMLRSARIILPKTFNTEISHHYGLGQFHKTGAVLIDLIENDIIHKYLVFFKGQMHPEHCHKVRLEYLKLIYGKLYFFKNKTKHHMKPGEFYKVGKSTWHRFVAKEDSIIEEISVKYTKDRSLYKDGQINKMKINDRKIKIVCSGNSYRIVNQ